MDASGAVPGPGDRDLRGGGSEVVGQGLDDGGDVPLLVGQ
jgi:hypothetical protein